MKRALLCVLSALAVFVCAADRRPLDYSDLTRWNSIRATVLSRDGKWLAYAQSPIEGDGDLFAKSTDGAKEFKVERGTQPKFDKGGRFVVYTIVPAKADVEKAKKAKQPALKNRYAVLNLQTGESKALEGAASVRMPDEEATWYVVQFEPPKDKKSYALELRRFGEEKSVKFDGVADYAVSDNGKGMAAAFADKGGLVWVDAAGVKTSIDADAGIYTSLTISQKTGAVAYQWTALEVKDKPKPKPVARLWVPGGKPTPVPVEGLAKEFAVAAKPGFRFSKDGKRLFFNAAKPAVEAPKSDDAEEAAVLDVWHWNDPHIQAEQLLDAGSEKNRGYLAVWNLGEKKAVQLETPEMSQVVTLANGNADYALGYDDRAYSVEAGWGQGGRDVYAVDLRDGSRKPIAKRLDAGVSASSTGRYAVWYDGASKGYFVYELGKDEKPRLVTQAIPTDLWNDLDDTPGDPSPYGVAGWTKNDAELLVNDKYDIWAVDPTGRTKPRCVTAGFGRRWKLVLRPLALEADAESIDPAKPLLLKSEDERTKADGFYAGAVKGVEPRKLRVEDRNFGQPTKAKDADVVVVTRQSFTEYPDLYVTDSSFKDLKRVTDANQQQAEYLWGSEELVEWTSGDGQKLQGILFKPANFDPTRKYPMILSFYEMTAWTYHSYHTPSPMGGAGANPSFYTSRGYLVFMPDIRYQVGYPGKGAVSAVVSGALSLVQRGFVDPARMGITGHSWGGYEVAYLVTQTNLFRCGVAGAAVSNMTSAYSGLRRGGGVLRQFQYEKGQSRIGGSIWQNPLQYIENSPIFWADRVQTPILLLHNDKDGAVPWEQSIEYYGALRRLKKPVWLIDYNGEDHGIGKMPNRKDWTIRQTQFFDHYLKGEPAPVWMTEGVPAVRKGETTGLEIKPPAQPAASGK